MEKQARHVTTLIESIDKRQQLESQMVNLVLGMHEDMREVEEMMAAGYDGREKDADRSMS
jgi:hypothetical protein